ncbi:MAG: DUF3368 domain-containing protein [Verrucomicrobia bacterium]|nr:DUF3368 domain-containing protein [Verrucomicrobiota bacterium]
MLAVVCDSSPLIYLSKLEHFRLLRVLYDAVLVPPAVWREVAIGGEGFAESANLKAAVTEGWIRIECPTEAEEAAEFPEELGLGEIEAILLARERKAVLVTDDALGRSVAESLGVEVTGTIGVLIGAKRQGQLSAVKPLIDRLKQQTNFRMSNALYQRALQIAGEAGPEGSR